MGPDLADLQTVNFLRIARAAHHAAAAGLEATGLDNGVSKIG
jgi:hypothetical protein